MTVSQTRLLIAAGLAAIVTNACRSATGTAAQTAPTPAPASARVQTSPAAVAEARADSARYPYTAADVHFMSGMIGHHAQALAMSRWAPTHGANPAVQRLAERIINGQQDDIVLMQQWLADRQKPVPQVHDDGRTMMVHGGDHSMLMPGMLTEAQMNELDRARGAEFDRLFLVYMIQHHRGAVAMVKDLFSSIGAGQDEIVFKFASDVNVDQSTEIARMEKMLAELLTNQRN